MPSKHNDKTKKKKKGVDFPISYEYVAEGLRFMGSLMEICVTTSLPESFCLQPTETTQPIKKTHYRHLART
jgi:hypothetical protein